MSDFSKPWDKWEPDSSDPSSTLREIARHMRNGWQNRANLGSVGFKAGHQLAHKGWKFGSGVVDLADGVAIPGIKGLRALIVSGKHEWFEQAAATAGTPASVTDAPNPVEGTYLTNLVGSSTPLRRFEVPEAEIWMLAEPHGWRVAAVFVRDASASGVKAALELAPATRGGCLALPLVCLSLLAGALLAKG